MIAFVKGVLAECRESSIVIENGGIGTEVFVPASLLPLLPSLGEEVFVYTHLRVAEDDLSLYGFLEKRDLLLVVKAGRTFCSFLPETSQRAY